MIICVACGYEIPLGHDSTFVSHGVIEESKKSGRPYHNEHEEDAIHSNFECWIRYQAKRLNTSTDQLADTTMDACKAHIEPDLRIEIFDELRSNYRDEIQEEVVDHLGHHCALCNEQDEDFHDAMERDVDPPWVQDPPPPEKPQFGLQYPQYPPGVIPIPGR